MRAQSILFSSKGDGRDDHAEMFEVSRNTVSIWIDQWEHDGVHRVDDHARSGAPSQLTAAEIDVVTHLITEHPHSPNRSFANIAEPVKNTISLSTLQRIVKKHRLRWKRVRTSLRHHRDDDEFDQAVHDIEPFQHAQQAGQIERVSVDESGCSLQSHVPDADQPIGETLNIPSSQRQRFTMLGVFTTTNQLDACSLECPIDADIVVACIDECSHHLVKKTVRILDHSSVQRCKKVEAVLEDWKARGLFLYYVPTSSPELKMIEIVWRFITDHWLPFSAYLSFHNVVKEVEHVLQHVGTTYHINFT